MLCSNRVDGTPDNEVWVEAQRKSALHVGDLCGGGSSPGGGCIYALVTKQGSSGAGKGPDTFGDGGFAGGALRGRVSFFMLPSQARASTASFCSIGIGTACFFSARHPPSQPSSPTGGEAGEPRGCTAFDPQSVAPWNNRVTGDPSAGCVLAALHTASHGFGMIEFYRTLAPRCRIACDFSVERFNDYAGPGTECLKRPNTHFGPNDALEEKLRATIKEQVPKDQKPRHFFYGRQ